MRLLRRAENLIVALTLVATGGSGLVYFYFSDTSWAGGMTVAQFRSRGVIRLRSPSLDVLVTH